MNKKLKTLAITIAAATTVLLAGASLSAKADTTLYRNWNSATGEHLYTSHYEWITLPTESAYWHMDSVTFTEPDTGSNVYRVYNPNSGEHLFTTSAYEKDSLVKVGWRYESIAFHSGGNTPVYRLYNPNAGIGAHLDTSSLYEKNSLVSQGWKYEGVAWYAKSAGSTTIPNVTAPSTPGSSIPPTIGNAPGTPNPNATGSNNGAPNGGYDIAPGHG
ncbi:hypothetical protein [Lactococcus termiticola]|uniref:DUF5648 domain-containing protein n=1 Tax=Lactococcus termiticola TaxID=2169526 RepID=A0A2R5HKQ7_9LACT|nr:hypothetical protein [Lactococcus termiticola]GBG97498.1 hypothetical protein NtB2_01644 [Lactococcus termiticola]